MAVGRTLGPLGGRIVAEMFIGLLQGTACPISSRIQTENQPWDKPRTSRWQIC
jgi:hypothetical protein